MQNAKRMLRKISASLAAAFMTVGTVNTSVYARQPRTNTVYADLQINGDTGTDIVLVNKDEAFAVSAAVTKDAIDEAFSDAWGTQTDLSTLEGATTDELTLTTAVTLPLDTTYFDISAMAVQKDGQPLSSDSYTVSSGMITISDKTVIRRTMTAEEAIAAVEATFSKPCVYTLSDIRLTASGKDASVLTLVANARITASANFSCEQQVVFETEEEANELAEKYDGIVMPNDEGPGYVAYIARAVNNKASLDAQQAAEGAYSGAPDAIAIALGTAEETPASVDVTVQFIDLDGGDAVIEGHSLNYEVDPEKGLKIDLKEKLDELKTLGYVPESYPTRLSGKTEIVNIGMRHDIEYGDIQGEPVTFERNFHFMFNETEIGRAGQSVTVTPGIRPTKDRVTGEVIDEEIVDPDVSFEAFDAPEIPGFTLVGNGHVDASTRKASECKVTVDHSFEYTRTSTEATKTVRIIFKDLNETAPQDLSSFNKEIEVKGVVLPDSTFVADEAVDTGLKSVVEQLVKDGYELQGTFPETVDGSKESFEISFKHGTQKKTSEKSEEKIRKITLVTPDEEDVIVNQKGTVSSVTETTTDSVTGDIVSEVTTYSAHFDRYDAPEKDGFVPDTPFVTAIDISGQKESITDKQIEDAVIVYQEAVQPVRHHQTDIIFECLLEDGTPVEELSVRKSFVDDDDTSENTEAFNSEWQSKIENSEYDIVNVDRHAKSSLDVEGNTATVMVFEYTLKLSETATKYVFDVRFEHPTDDVSEYDTAISTTYKADPGEEKAEEDLEEALEPVIAELSDKGYIADEVVLIPDTDASTEKEKHITVNVMLKNAKTVETHTISVGFTDIDPHDKTDLSDIKVTFAAEDGVKPKDFASRLNAELDKLEERGYVLISSAQVDALTFEEDADVSFFMGHRYETTQETTDFKVSDKIEKYARKITMHFSDGSPDKVYTQYGSGSTRRTVRKDLVTGKEKEENVLMKLNLQKLKVSDIETSGMYTSDIVEIPMEILNGPLPIDSKPKDVEIDLTKKDMSKHHVYFVIDGKVLEGHSLEFDLVDGKKPEGYADAINAELARIEKEGYIVTPFKDAEPFTNADRYIEVEYDIEKTEVSLETPITRTIKVNAPTGSKVPAETKQNGMLVRTVYRFRNHTTGEEWEEQGPQKAVFPEFHFPAIDGYVLKGEVKAEVAVEGEYKDGMLDVTLSYEKKDSSKPDAKPADNSKKNDSQNTSPNAKSGNTKTGTSAPVAPMIIGGTALVALAGAGIVMYQKKKKEKNADNDAESAGSEE